MSNAKQVSPFWSQWTALEDPLEGSGTCTFQMTLCENSAASMLSVMQLGSAVLVHSRKLFSAEVKFGLISDSDGFIVLDLIPHRNSREQVNKTLMTKQLVYKSKLLFVINETKITTVNYDCVSFFKLLCNATINTMKPFCLHYINIRRSKEI